MKTLLASAALSSLLSSVALAQLPNICIHPNTSMQQIEPSVATHPSNPNTMLAVSIASSTIAPVVTTGWHFTADSGQTWIGRDTLPTFSNLNLNMVDPAVGIDADGNMYVTGLYGVLGSSFDVYVARSTDNGADWTQTIITSPINAERTHLTIDVNPSSPYKNYFYLGYSENSVSGTPIKFIRSTDRGQSFSAPVTISGSIGSVRATGVNLAVGADSLLYATWSGFDYPPPGPIRLGFNKTTDGGLSWGTAANIRSISGIGPYLNKGGNAIAVWSVPSMGVDRSPGSRRGWIYCVYADKNPTTPDVLLIRSTDGGNTWSNPTKVNQDNSGRDQWNPWISVDPSTGNLFVVYYDSRNFSANDSAQVYISASTDGGDTFRDLLVSDAPFLPAQPTAVIAPPYGYMGGYIGITALQGVVWPCWNDNRTGMHQLYTSRIVTDSVFIPATINVRPGALDFGDLLIGGQPETLKVIVENLAFTDSLLVTDIHSDSSAFIPETASLGVPPRGMQAVNIVFNPSSVGLLNATLTITSSDPAHPTTSVAMRAIVRPMTPTLVSPPSGATNQPISPTLTWNSIGASSYRLQVGNSSFTTIVFEDSTITDTSRQVGPLADSTRYYWRVSGKVNGANSQYSQARSFRTIVAAPSPPILLSPANGAIDQPVPLSLRWSRSRTADTYRVQISKDSLFISTVFDDSLLTDTSQDIGVLEPEVKYYWRVQAKNIGGISAWSAVWNYLTSPEVTRHYSVLNGWNMLSVPMTVSDYTKSNLFPTSVSKAFAYDTGYAEKDTLTNGAGYWLRFGGTQSVNITGLLRVLDSVAVQTGWNLIGSISFPVKVTTIASDPPNLVTSQFFGYSGGYSLADTIQPGQGYWVKVSQGGKLILSSTTNIPASAHLRMELKDETPPPPPGGGEVLANRDALPTAWEIEQNYPNPFNPTTVIRYGLPKAELVRLSVFNVLGQEVATLVNEVQDAGYKVVVFDPGALPSGVYFYRLQAGAATGGFTGVKKMILAR